MQRILKGDNQIVIIADDREKNSSILDSLKEMKVKINFVRLNVGDYIISDRACIERKTGEDFVNSVINGRIFEQVEELKRNFDKPILLIEGRYDRDVNENAMKAALSSIVLQYGVPVIMSENNKETARIVYWLAKKEQEEFKRLVGIKGKKKPKETAKLQEHVLSSFPGISSVLSKRLLQHFKSIKAAMSASESELAKVKGVNKKIAKKIYQLLNEKYEGE